MRHQGSSRGAKANFNRNLIGRATSVEEIINALARRGCSNLTSSIDLTACSDLPCAGGGFCDVYRGMLCDGTGIAIKVLRVYDRPGRGSDRQKILKRAARELYHWSKLQHRNVLPLMGLTVFRGHISMVSGWMENGCLMSYLRLNPEANRMKLCMDVCAGLSYIHTNGMVHGDLKAANVMVSPGGDALIADFGNAELRDLTLKFTNTTKGSISVRWTAPELLLADDSPQVSKEADVYAYAMTVLEVMTGKVPFEGIGDNRVMFLVASGKIPPRPDFGMQDELWRLLTQCWTQEPTGRPEITSIRDHLQALFQPPLNAPSIRDTTFRSQGTRQPGAGEDDEGDEKALTQRFMRFNFCDQSGQEDSDREEEPSEGEKEFNSEGVGIGSTGIRESSAIGEGTLRSGKFVLFNSGRRTDADDAAAFDVRTSEVATGGEMAANRERQSHNSTPTSDRGTTGSPSPALNTRPHTAATASLGMDYNLWARQQYDSVARTWAALRREEGKIELEEAVVVALGQRLTQLCERIEVSPRSRIDMLIHQITKDESRMLTSIEAVNTILQHEKSIFGRELQRIVYSRANTPRTDRHTRTAWDYAEKIWRAEVQGIQERIDRVAAASLDCRRRLAAASSHRPSTTAHEADLPAEETVRPPEPRALKSDYDPPPMASDRFVRDRRPPTQPALAPAPTRKFVREQRPSAAERERTRNTMASDERMCIAAAWAAYEYRWAGLQAPVPPAPIKPLTFHDIPRPAASPPRPLTPDNIKWFPLPPKHSHERKGEID